MWNAKYSGFFDQLKAWLNEELWQAGGLELVREKISSGTGDDGVVHTAGRVLVGGPIGIPLELGRRVFKSSAVARKLFNYEFKKAMKGIPNFSLGSIVACAMHDYDNNVGVQAVSPLGPDGEQPFPFRASGEGAKKGGTFNDDSGKDSDATKRLAIAATRAGRADVAAAFSRGKMGGTAATIMAALKSSGPACDGSTYQAERYKPTEQQAATNVKYDWQKPDLNKLQYDTQLGRAISFSVRNVILPSLSSIADTMAAIAPLLDPVKDKLDSEPLETLKEIAGYATLAGAATRSSLKPTRPEPSKTTNLDDLTDDLHLSGPTLEEQGTRQHHPDRPDWRQPGASGS